MSDIIFWLIGLASSQNTMVEALINSQTIQNDVSLDNVLKIDVPNR
jgi:hypothetical protein